MVNFNMKVGIFSLELLDSLIDPDGQNTRLPEYGRPLESEYFF